MMFEGMGVIAPPTSLPTLVPARFNDDCLHLASALRSFHFVLHDSRRADLPAFLRVFARTMRLVYALATSRLFTFLGC